MHAARYIANVRSRVEERNIQCTDQHIIECFKYLAIMSLTPGRRIAVTPDVDEVWHELIVQTSAYRRLCLDLPGKRFINHESISPESYSGRVGNAEFVDEFLRWIPDYVQSYGPFNERRAQHWTVVQFLRDAANLTLEEINDLGTNTVATASLPKASKWRNIEDDRIATVLTTIEAAA